MKTVALYGGSFDPPHIGHKAIVDALEKLNFIDEIVVMPTYLNPFKSQFFAPSELRLKWLKEIFEAYKKTSVSDYEVLQQERVPSISTVKYLLQSYKKIFFVIGADNVATLHQWQSYKELKQRVTFIVATRDRHRVSDDFMKIHINQEISSTKLRQEMDITKLPKKCAQEIAQYYKENNAK